MGYLKQKFPCGYEIEIRMGILDNFRFEDGGGCPIHGKDCPKKQKENKK